MIKYGILDDLGHVIRWVFDRPSGDYKFVTVKVKRTRKRSINLSHFIPAPF